MLLGGKPSYLYMGPEYQIHQDLNPTMYKYEQIYNRDSFFSFPSTTDPIFELPLIVKFIIILSFLVFLLIFSKYFISEDLTLLLYNHDVL